MEESEKKEDVKISPELIVEKEKNEVKDEKEEGIKQLTELVKVLIGKVSSLKKIL